MNSSFYLLMWIFGAMAGLNLILARKQNDSKFRTIGILFNEFALVCIVIAVIISFFTK